MIYVLNNVRENGRNDQGKQYRDTCNIGLKTENEDKQNTTKKAQKMSNTDPNIKRAVTGGARERKLVLFSYSFTHSRVR